MGATGKPDIQALRLSIVCVTAWKRNKKEVFKMNQLQPGDAAPAFSAVDQHGNTIDLSDYEGRRVFIFFYPKANTSG
jgi:peroxiredoxin